jgi:hypothetical protein
MQRRQRRAWLQHMQDERDKRARQAQERADRAAARARWAPANDPAWLREAGLADTASAWCAAVPFAEAADPRFEQSADAAVKNCEARLRTLHPHAMARYDRLRDDGLGRVEAMREAAPLFARPPRVHGPEHHPTLALPAGQGGDSWSLMVHGPSREDFETAMRHKRDERGSQIARRLQASAGRHGGTPLTGDELRVTLETRTSLPLDTIAAIAPARSGGARGDRQPWRDDFPFPISAVIAARARTSPSPAAPRREETPDRRHGHGQARSTTP